MPRAEAPIGTLPLSFAIAEEGGAPVVDDAWLAAEVTEANRLFSPQGLVVATLRTRALAGSFSALESGDDRDRLAAHREARVLNVFVVKSLRDVDDPRLLRMGVRWRLRRNLAVDYVILAASALPSTLAHELGHALGLGHSSVVDNVMSYDRRDPMSVRFDDRQGRVMRAQARAMLRTKKLASLEVLTREAGAKS